MDPYRQGWMGGYEVHSPSGDCYLHAVSRRRWTLRPQMVVKSSANRPGSGGGRAWEVVWKGQPVGAFFKRQWAREHIRLLKIQEIHES